MRNSEQKRLVLALSIQRIPFLRSDEKLLLWDLVDDELSLSVLLSRDVEAAIGRGLGERPWTPDSYLEAAVRDAVYLERSGCRFIHFDDGGYPEALRETSRPPFGLFARGTPLSSGARSVAIVGTRLPTGRGLASAFELSSGLAEAGVTVISGLAKGIDSAAHRGAMAGFRSARSARSGPESGTCAILPCGIDAVYPPGNRRLAQEILEEGGLLLSEYPPGEEIRKYRFPERNRIIAGMSRACVVVEAPAKSGALITAEHALDEGRDVWVSLPCLGGPRSAGIDRLAAEGAPVAGSAADILADWGLASSGAEVAGARAAQARDRWARGAEGEGARLASSLFDELSAGPSGVPGEPVSSLAARATLDRRIE
jgi:DNA processing protein